MEILDLTKQIRKVDSDIPNSLKNDEYRDNFSRFLDNALSAQYHLNRISNLGFKYEINVIESQDKSV